MAANVTAAGTVDLPGVFYDQTMKTPCQLRRTVADGIRCLPGVRVEAPTPAMTYAVADQYGVVETLCATAAECDAMATSGMFVGNVLYVDAACTKVGVQIRDTTFISADDTRFVYVMSGGGSFRKLGARAQSAYRRSGNACQPATVTGVVSAIGDVVPMTAFAEVRQAFPRR